MDTPEGQKLSRQGSGAELLTAPSRGQLRRAAQVGELINAEYEKTRDFVERATPAELAHKKLEIQSLNQLCSEAAALAEEFFGEEVHGLSEHREDRIAELERLSLEIADVAAVIRGEGSQGAPAHTVEPGEDPQLNELFVAAGFADDFSAPSAGTSDTPEALAGTQEPREGGDKQESRLVDFYYRWQNGDPSLFLDMWGRDQRAIRRDILVLLKAAGYDELTVADIDREQILPWMGRVGMKKLGRLKDCRWSELRDEILHTVSELLAGKEPDLAVLAPQEAVVSPQPQTEASPVGAEPQPEALDTVPDIDKELEQAQFQFLTLRDRVAALPELSVWLELGDRILSVLSTMTERDQTVVLRLKTKYLKTLHDLNQRLEKELSERPGGAVAVMAADSGSNMDVPANLPVESVTNTSPGSGVEVTNPEGDTVPLVQPEAVAPASEPPVLTAVVEQGYKAANHERAEAREAFTKARDEYYTALHAHYRNLGVKARELVGMEVNLPESILNLKAEHDKLQRVYAQALDKALAARASVVGNREYATLEADSTKAAFAKRFIFRSVEEIEAEKRAEYPSVFASRVKALVTFMRNHKTVMRVGALGLHMTVGAVSGGVANAAFVGAKVASGMVAGAAGGLAGANVGRRVFQADVEAAQANKTETKAKATNEFSFASLGSAAKDYQVAYRSQQRTETKHTVATVAGAVIGGMAAGRAASEVVSDVWNAVATDPIIEMKAVAVPRFAPNGEPLPALSVEGITLRGAHVTDLATGDLEVTDVVIPKVMSEIRLHIKDLLEAHPNMSQGKLEEEVFARLEAKYGEQGWWQKADIKNLDISTIAVAEVPKAPIVQVDGPVVEVSPTPEVIPTAPAAPTPEVSTPVIETPTEVEVTSAPTEASAPSVEATVQVEHSVTEGDTLMKIMETEYADVLKEVAPADRDRILTELFERARNDATLRDSIGLKSGDIDRIYPGEELKLDALGTELKSLLESESVRPRTGVLPVAMEGGVEDVPIQINNSPIDANYIDKGAVNGYMERTDFDTADVMRQGVNAYNPPRPEVSFVASGNYFDSPQYRSFLIENNVPPELVEDATKKFALEFEGRTYSWLNELLQKYDSPYQELRSITVQELDALRKEAGNSEEALRVLLAKQAAAEAVERGVAVGEVPKTFNVSTVRAWDSLIDAIRRTDGFVYNENTTVEDLVKRYVGEQMIKNNYNASVGVRGK